jgi:hypothetical protein
VPAPGFPDGRLVLTWMGDMRLRLWDPRGEASVQASPIRGRFVRLAAWTDGFPGQWERLTNDGLRRLIAACPLQDDLAVLEIWLCGRALANRREAMSQKERV